MPSGCTSYDGLALQVPEAEAFDTDGCFHAQGGVLLAEPRPGLTLLGASAALTNDQILDGDNAAVALRLLGQRTHLVWYVPSLADLVGRDGVSPSSLLPRWLAPALWLLLMAVVAPGRVALAPARAAGRRAAAGGDQGGRDHPQPRVASTAGPATAATRRRRCGRPPGPG